jgi:cysteine desulfurase / selenocysteine lyase
MMEVKQLLSVEKIKEDFPILNKLVNGKRLVYFDNSATTLTPNQVVEAMAWYYKNCKASVHRSVHTLGVKASMLYGESRDVVADFVNSQSEEIVFTSGATESLNLVAYSIGENLKEGDEIILSEMEHHSNIVPWQQIAKRKGLILRYIKVLDDGSLDIKQAKEIIGERTKVVSVTHVSNVLGTVNDVKTLGEIAHSVGAIIVVDGAQAVSSMKINVKELDCDFYVFSGHKMTGPTGIGVLYGKKNLFEKMEPFLFGGGMIKDVGFEETTWNEIPLKFEAGTPKIAEAIGLAQAIKYLSEIGMKRIWEHNRNLTEYALKKLGEIEGLKIFGSRSAENRTAVISFSINGIHPHDVSSILDKQGVAVRGGHMCAQPLVSKVLGVDSVTRASLYFYNSLEDIDLMIEGIKRTKEVFS